MHAGRPTNRALHRGVQLSRRSIPTRVFRWKSASAPWRPEGCDVARGLFCGSRSRRAYRCCRRCSEFFLVVPMLGLCCLRAEISRILIHGGVGLRPLCIPPTVPRRWYGLGATFESMPACSEGRTLVSSRGAVAWLAEVSDHRRESNQHARKLCPNS